jgi:hypothetical protein
LESRLGSHGYEAVASGAGPVLQLSFMSRSPGSYRDTLAANTPLYCDFAIAMLDEGVLVVTGWPLVRLRKLKAMLTSSSHSPPPRGF